MHPLSSHQESILTHRTRATIAEFGRICLPGLSLSIKASRSSPSLTALVRKGELDMALVEENDAIGEMVKISVAQDRYGFFRSSKEKIRKPGAKTFDRLGIGAISPDPEEYTSHLLKFTQVLGKQFRPTFLAESYELLRSTAVAGSIVAILPTRVANRRPNELVEIFPSGDHPSKLVFNYYKIFLIHELGCPTDESNFLAKEIKSLISA